MLAIEGVDPLGEVASNPHPALGLVAIICAIIQPIMAAFRAKYYKTFYGRK